MNTKAPVRLADDVVVEPLVSSWPAWWMTLAPLPASLHLKNYQVPVLESFLREPEAHARAAAQGMGAVAISPSRTPEARALLKQMLTRQAGRIKLAKEFERFQSWLVSRNQGQSLEPAYRRVPPSLQGMVELVYDYHNRASIRVLEPLAYRRYGDPSLQSLRFFRLRSHQQRPFFLSTPRLLEPGEWACRIPFQDKRLDTLFALDARPQPLRAIAAALGVDCTPSFAGFFREGPVRPPPKPWKGPGVRIRYIGHACALVEWAGRTVLTDPFVPTGSGEDAARPISFADLPAHIDYVLITHGHSDHFWIETLLRLRHRVGTLVVPKSHGQLLGDVSLKVLATQLGFDHVVEAESFDELPMGAGRIIALPFLGEQGDLDHAKSAYLLRLGGQQILFTADAACLDPKIYALIRSAVGKIETVFANIGDVGLPFHATLDALIPADRNRTREEDRRARSSNASEGLRVARELGVRRLFNYALGLEPWMAPVLGPPTPRNREWTSFLRRAKSRGLQATSLAGPQEIVLR